MAVSIGRTLNYQQRVILYLYKVFFSCDYNDDRKDTLNGVNSAHLKMQKMMYLLYIYGLQIGDFTFVWNKRGPYSYDLSCVLKEIDDVFSQKEDDIIQQLKDDDYISLELGDYQQFIDELNEKLKINVYKNNVVDWIELLGSLVYLSQTVLPGCRDKEILTELYNRKEKYSADVDRCNDAIQNLKKVGLLTCA